MAIQHRRGSYTDFDPTKMAPGEFAVVQSDDPAASDGEAVYLAFAAGEVKRLATHDELQEEVLNEITAQTANIIQEIHDGIEADVERAETAAATFDTDTTLAQSGKAADAKTVGDALADLSAYTFTDANSDGNIVITAGGGGS